MRLSQILGAAVVSVLMCLSTARADLFHTHNSGTWNDVNDWIQGTSTYPANRIPGSGDTVYVDHDLSVPANASAGYLEVKANFTLTVESGVWLTVHGGAGPSVTYTGGNIHGTLVLNNAGLSTPSVADHMAVHGGGKIVMSGEYPAIELNHAECLHLLASGLLLNAQADLGGYATLYGSGSLIGNHDNAQIGVKGGTQLWLYQSKIQGHLTVQTSGGSGSGLFFSFVSTILADDPGGQMLFASSIELSDWAGSLWSTLSPEETQATLRIDRTPSSGLAGDFVAAGRVRINNNLTTSGTLSLLAGGTVEVVTGKTFAYSGGVASDPCNILPATTITGPFAGSCP